MSAMWKLEKDLCRCCHAEGSFKHLSDPCFLLGQEEIYSVMLQDCLDIKIVPMTGPLCDATYTICESCVARLRDASNFKRQVQDCEERFKEMYSKNMIKGFAVKDEPCESDADMKQEFQSVEEDEDDDDAFMKFDDEGDDASSYEEHEEMISVEIEAESSAKGKGKAKAKPKPKPKKAPVKKTKSKEKPIKVETEELTEAAVSGEKKKGHTGEYLKYCTKTGEGESQVYTCKICDKSYKRKAIRQHILHVHLKLKKETSACVICKVPLSPYLKYKHMEEAHGWKSHTCRACGKKFPYKNRLEWHQRVYHLGEKDFKCELCDMAFGTRQGLTRHSAMHSTVRPFICEYCSKTYKTKKILSKHIKIHLNEAKCVCGICDCTFVTNGRLKYHMTQEHPIAENDSSGR